MQRVGFGDHRIARRNRRGKIAPADAIKRKRKIVGSKDHHWPNGRHARIKFLRSIDGDAPPRSLPRRGRRLPELIRCPGKLHVLQPWRYRKRRLFVGYLHNGFDIRVQLRRISLKKRGDLLPRDMLQFTRRRLAAVSARSQSLHRLTGNSRPSFSPVDGFSGSKTPSASDSRHSPPIQTFAVATAACIIPLLAPWSHHSTGFTSSPIPSIPMRTVSPFSSVNESGGTTPVPVRRKQPKGKV